MRRRRSASFSSGTLTRNGRIALLPSAASTTSWLSNIAPAAAVAARTSRRVADVSDMTFSRECVSWSDGRDGSRSDQVVSDGDVALCRLRIGTDLFRIVDQALGDASVDVGNGDVEPSAEEVLTVAVPMQIDLGVDRDLARELDLLLLRHNRDRTLETGRPAGRKQLFRIGANPRRARNRKLDIEPPVGAARGAILAPASRVG